MSATEPLLPVGFRAAAVHCGIKKEGLLDLSLIVSDRPATCAGVFTTNLVHGAPVKVCRERIGRSSSRGVVLNSGNSNACTGDKGIADAKWMTAEVAGLVGCDPEDILVCSTGVIGRFLPLDQLRAGIPDAFAKLSSNAGALTLAARGMMTTDTFPKTSTRELNIDGKTVRFSGVAKGAAMIAPNMATMLSVVVTDLALDAATAQRLLKHAVDRSFNCISVEGHMSTSDTVLLLANGASGVSLSDEATVQQVLNEVTADLARAIIRDAEGADHEITIDVTGARTREEAFRIAKSIADSPLVKTAITGGDPNWGRIVSAAGYAGVMLREEDISLRLNGVPLYQQGAPVPFDAASVSRHLKDNRQVQIELLLTLGNESVRFWTCDLTAEYVRLNADYTT